MIWKGIAAVAVAVGVTVGVGDGIRVAEGRTGVGVAVERFADTGVCEMAVEAPGWVARVAMPRQAGKAVSHARTRMIVEIWWKGLCFIIG